MNTVQACLLIVVNILEHVMHASANLSSCIMLLEDIHVVLSGQADA